MEKKVIDINVLVNKKTGLMVAISDAMPGLYVHARTDDELRERIPVTIRALLEAEGMTDIEVREIDDPAAQEAGFAPRNPRFQAAAMPAH